MITCLLTTVNFKYDVHATCFSFYEQIVTKVQLNAAFADNCSISVTHLHNFKCLVIPS